ncbi:excalibur calcium-binding domain-containing protein [Sphingomonas sp. MMS12-HWE2-04]|uniref:excalibur calcium-binding domain-containing protein n=1 Tax=Sphingomonas sp. MMS12-HWE2-04 TaxID=3234199 RepID=UPI00384FF949
MLAASSADAASGDPRKSRKAKPRRISSAQISRVATDSYYPNCATARSAGAAPIKRGDPGYSGQLDRDGDGIACER